MDLRYSTRIKLGMSLIVFLTLAPALRQLRSTLSSFHTLPRTDDISLYEQRFTEVTSFLPPNQIVSYRGECDAFVLTQYSLAPTVLGPLACPGGHLTDAGTSARHKSRLILDNSLDPHDEPYLVDLFPDTFRSLHNNAVSLTEGDESSSDQMVFLNDFGHGVRTYAHGNT
jgi:hypothetical protein